MRTRLAFVLVATLLTSAGIGCGSGSSASIAPARSLGEPTPALPTPVPPAPPFVDPLAATRSAIAASPVLIASGWVIYLRGNDLYAGDLLTGNETPLTQGSGGAGYAGRAEIRGETWIYYTSLTDRARDPRTTAGAFAVYRRQAGTVAGPEEKLFEFAASDRYRAGFSDNASVSSDGRDVAYTDDAGLHVYDIDSRDDQLVLSNQPATSRLEAGGGIRGLRYYRPVWAPKGGWLYIEAGDNRSPYNRLYDETLRPLESDTEYRLTNHGDDWSPDGERLCGNTSQTAAGGVGILTPGSADVIDYTANVFDNAILRPALGRCNWASDGRIAVGYEADQLNHFTIAILDDSGTVAARIDAGAVVPGEFSWLPDYSGFVIETLSDSLVATSGAVMLDGTYRRLPFAAEHVLGAIPLVPPKDD